MDSPVERPGAACDHPIHRVVAGTPVTLDASALTDPKDRPIDAELAVTWRVTDRATADEACAPGSAAEVLEEAMIVFRDDTALLPAEAVQEGRTVILRLRIPGYHAFLLLEPTSEPGGESTVVLRPEGWLASSAG